MLLKINVNVTTNQLFQSDCAGSISVLTSHKNKFFDNDCFHSIQKACGRIGLNSDSMHFCLDSCLNSNYILNKDKLDSSRRLGASAAESIEHVLVAKTLQITNLKVYV